MKRIIKNSLEVMQFENTAFNNCIQGIFTRKGGVSQGQWKSLNQGGNIGDQREFVLENRKRAFNFFDRSVDSIFDVWQVHSNNVVCVSEPRKQDEPHIQADAIFTDNSDVTLFMRFADCVPILIYAPEQKVVGIIHAGWKGTVNNIVAQSIHKIIDQYQVNPKNIIAGIGPSIGLDHYQVGKDVFDCAQQSFQNDVDQIIHVVNGHYYFDLWKANEILLKNQGIEEIETAKICTACHLEDWYSHRAENGATGRFGAMIALQG